MMRFVRLTIIVGLILGVLLASGTSTPSAPDTFAAPPAKTPKATRTPKATHTPKPTRTPRATRTPNTPATFTPTMIATATEVPSTATATPTEIPPTATPTPTPTATPCIGIPVAMLSPGGGPQLSILPLDASESFDPCGRELRFFWECQGTNSQTCIDFLAATGGSNGGSVESYDFPLAPGAEHVIGVTVCVIDGATQVCSNRVVYQYFGSDAGG